MVELSQKFSKILASEEKATTRVVHCEYILLCTGACVRAWCALNGPVGQDLAP